MTTLADLDTARLRPLIAKRFTYRGKGHPGVVGCEVRLAAILRLNADGEVTSITEDELIGEVRPTDFVEFQPILNGRPCFVGYDGRAEELVSW